MYAYFARRLLLIVPTLLGVTMLVFSITRYVPGGPMEREIMRIRQGQAMGGEGGAGGSSGVIDPTAQIPEEALDQLRKQYRFDMPGWKAYLLWLGDVVRLDLGESFYKFKKTGEGREKVLSLVIERFPISLSFGLTGFVLSYLVCIPLGIFKALRHGSTFDVASSFIVFVGYSIPGWALGVLLLLFFASGSYLEVFPLGGIQSSKYNELPSFVQAMEPREEVVRDGSFDRDLLPWWARAADRIQYMFLPVLCYMAGSFASLTVLMKNSLMENLGQDYVRTAFAKGLSPNRVIFLHTLRNSLIPLATGLGHALGLIMAGSYLIELVFNIDGLGYLGFNAIVQRDYTVVMGVLVINVLLLLIGNILSDILYALIDPRIRFE